MKPSSIAGCIVVTLAMLTTAIIWTVGAPPAAAHCQMPCGIYDDAARIGQLKEDAATITKALNNINELAGKNDAQSFNQAARWVAVKEEHASHIITVVAEYFLTQKVKPVASGADGYSDYLASLADHHAVMVAAMKTKQHADLSFAAVLDKTIDELAKHYK